MLRSLPKLSYNGLTVVLSNPSRFDKADLLTANAGHFFSEVCLRPDFNRYQCDIRLAEDKSPLIPNTRCVFLLGEKSMKEWLGSYGANNSLGELRGSPFVINEIPHIASYFPQDCVDLKDFESDLNPLSEHYTDPDVDDKSNDDDDDDDDKDSTSEKRRHGFTKRKNYGFWLLKDTEKCKHILLHGLPEVKEPEYVIYPRLEFVVDILTKTKNEYFYIDIETDSDLNITVFSFSFGSKIIYVVPCLLPDYSCAYSGLHQIFKALAVCIRDNITVAHNGSNFDFFVFAYKYRIPIGRRVYDTLIAHHRCFPEIEKSLGHCTSLWTWERFHKDMGDVPYNNLDNARRMWSYCGTDVFTMALVREAIDAYAVKHPGVAESIKQANESIRPYLTTSLMGIRYDASIREKTLSENDRLMTQYIRMLEILIGKDNLKTIRGKGTSTIATSNPQCCRYFHEMLGYPVIGKGKEKKDGTRNASLGKKNMFKLRLKHENPVIDIILAYREVSKESGSLKFTPWKE